MNSNPFEFKYPDDIDPKDVIDLFVPVFGEYYNVPKSGHTFINGARGSGKSMMFRYMKPDCQVLVDNEGRYLEVKRDIHDIDYFSIYIPIKKGHLNITDININDTHGEALLNEHFMTLHFSMCIFKELKDIKFEDNSINISSFLEFYNIKFCKYLKYAGYYGDIKLSKAESLIEIFDKIIEVFREINADFQHNYIKKLIGSKEPLPYNGVLLLYSDFLYEILKEIRNLPFMPSKPIFLLIDDADELSIIQRKILNSWVAMRTTIEVSLKISTQLKYKIFQTINDSRIDTPHDYSEVNINDIYTTKKDLYYQRIEQIVTKRLQKYNFSKSSPSEFFPENKKQAELILQLKNKYIQEQIDSGKTEPQAYDFAYRYTIPDYIKNLQGNRYTYSYSGFKQLVNVSSGIIRVFIDFASEMFVSQISENGSDKVEFIKDSIQDKVIKKVSGKVIESEFDKYREEASDKKDMDKLRNLILGMGGLFMEIIKSNASERRVFSIALNDEPDDELRRILDLGIQHGYLQKSMIGNKYGTGKARLYILSRLLAPHFVLDPSSFAGYKFMNSEILKISLVDPKKFIRKLASNIKGIEDNTQPTLFDKMQ